ncbi:MAG: hypothetical protein NTW94_02175, partial [Legionellales bacterium]|nr:hypothetical protein [Legionellales bacterium]
MPSAIGMAGALGGSTATFLLSAAFSVVPPLGSATEALLLSTEGILAAAGEPTTSLLSTFVDFGAGAGTAAALLSTEGILAGGAAAAGVPTTGLLSTFVDFGAGAGTAAALLSTEGILAGGAAAGVP